jgi:hypothetical protein
MGAHLVPPYGHTGNARESGQQRRWRIAIGKRPKNHGKNKER